jgi:GT2 family glycosyltransferase
LTSKVPIIIPFYKAREELERCLAHLQRQTYPGIEVFVRDNSEDNIYFTAAVNEGLRRFIMDPAVRYIGVLNQDAYLEPRAIEVLVDFLERHTDAGVACPLQLNAAGKVSWGGSLRAFPTGAHRHDPAESYRAPEETPWANGAAMLIRTDTLREVGLFDANMRFMCSDADFSFTVRSRGWKVFLVPEARCEHTLHGSSITNNLELEAVKLRDVLYFSRKWVSGDLYRALAYEGPQLTRTGVRMEIAQLENMLAMVERRLATTNSPAASPAAVVI